MRAFSSCRERSRSRASEAQHPSSQDDRDRQIKLSRIFMCGDSGLDLKTVKKNFPLPGKEDVNPTSQSFVAVEPSAKELGETSPGNAAVVGFCPLDKFCGQD